PGFRTHKPFEFEPRDTVGAVALDQKGNLAAATSTGGTARKMVGRVGDSPVVGAGAYADNYAGAASATGWGESIMKVVLSKTLCDFFGQKTAPDAARDAIQYLEKRVNGLGGIIGINPKGDYAFAHNTPKMAHAFADDNGQVIARLRAQ
ncbi:MAG: peptidase T, partial [Bacteroidetes bacterium]